MRLLLLIICAAILGGFTPHDEDVSGWKFVRSLPVGAPLHGVAVAHAPLPARYGATSLRFEVRPGDCSRAKYGWDDCRTDRERSELKQTGYQYHGETWRYAFSLYVPKAHRNIWPAKLSFAQFHQEGAKPVIMFQNQDGGLWLDIHNSFRTIKLSKLIAAPQLRGRWSDIIMQVRWSRKSDGFIRVWVGDRQAASYHGANMTEDKVYFKFGLYRSHVSRNQHSRDVTHTAYFDNVVRARIRADVELAK